MEIEDYSNILSWRRGKCPESILFTYIDY